MCACMWSNYTYYILCIIFLAHPANQYLIVRDINYALTFSLILCEN